MKAIILDRDGVINEDSDQYIKNPEEWIPIDGSVEAIATLSRAGYAIYVATNQSGLGRGLFGQSELDAMHSKMNHLIEKAGGSLAGIYYCPHRPEQHCDCRKPAPGLLQNISRDTGISLEDVPLVGDSLRDLQAGQAVGCKPVLVKTGKGLGTLEKLQLSSDPMLDQLPVFESLAQVAQELLESDTLSPGDRTE